jgi:protein-disulfide isomerase
MRRLVDLAASVTMIAAAAVVAWVALQNQAASARGSSPRPENLLPTHPVSVEGARILGDKSAPVGVMIFSDLECPVSGTLARNSLPQLVATYVESKKIFVAYRHFPLSSIHPAAERAAEALECAGDQGRFWDMHNALYADQRNLDEASLLTKAGLVGLESVAFRTCLASEVRSRVKADRELGEKLNVMGTPTVFVGRRRNDGTLEITNRTGGYRPFDDLKKIIDTALDGSR